MTPGGRRYRALLALAGAALLWERLWPRLWPAACVVGLFAAVALLDLLPLLPPWPHALLLGAFAVSFLAAIAWSWPALRLPRRAEMRQRLERDSGLAHGPLTALEDRLAMPSDDPLSRQLWARHQLHAREALSRLRVRLPTTEIARHEPWGLRAGVGLLLVIALAGGRGDGIGRLERAFTVRIGAAATPAQVDLWISPPAYTGVAPIYRAAGPATAPAPAPAPATAIADTTLHVPVGSRVLVRVAGPGRAPLLEADGRSQPLERLSAEGERPLAWRGETTIERGDRLVIHGRRGVLATWPIKVIADAPPTVTFAAPPAAAGNGLFALDYHAADDYGVDEVTAVINPVETATAAARDAERRVVLQTPAAERLRSEASPLFVPGAGSGAEVADGDAAHNGEKTEPLRAVLDLAADALAGRRVRATLEARDAVGQLGRSETVDFVLPERLFAHPVARRIAEERKRLFAADTEVRFAVTQQLAAIARDPAAFAGDIVVTLALSVARARLLRDDRPDAVASVRDLLWQAALRLDQGEVPMAERQLMQARDALVQALRRGADTAEIERLTDALQAALNRYLEAVAMHLAQQGAQAMPALPGEMTVQSEDLRDLVETARELARTGSREAALQALAQLQRVLDALRSSLASGPSADAQQAQEMLNTLQSLAQRQQELLDRSFERLRQQREQRTGQPPRAVQEQPGAAERSRRPAPAQRPSAEDEADLAQQQALRRELGELMLKMGGMLGEIPVPLGDADQAMRGAAGALGQGRLSEAVPGQSRAVDALRRALDATGQAMAQRMGGMLGFAPGGGQRGGGDVFGRRPGGTRGFADEAIGIPAAGELNRAQGILDELRRRAAERSRPRQELDYIERLLRTY